MNKLKRFAMLGIIFALISSVVVGSTAFAVKDDSTAYKDLETYVDNTTFKDLSDTASTGEYTKIGIISDVHIQSDSWGVKGTPTEFCVEKFYAALDYYCKQDVDAILITGDFVSFGSARPDDDGDGIDEGDLPLMDWALEQYFGSPNNPDMPKLLFANGNHEYQEEFDDAGNKNFAMTDPKVIWGRQKQYLQRWVDYEIYNGIESGSERTGSACYSYVSGDITVISMSADRGGSYGSYSDGVIQELEDELAAARERANGKPILLGIHYPWAEGVFGKSHAADNNWSDQAKKILNVVKKYPEVIMFTGHTHYSNLHARSISQDEGFTAINVGSVHGPENANSATGEKIRYANRGNYDVTSVNGLKTISRYHQWSTGMMVTYMEEGVQIDRINFFTGNVYDCVEPWFIPYGITSENASEKFSYVVSELKANAAEDSLTWDSTDKVTISDDMGVMYIRWPSVKEVNDVEGYVITIKKNGKVVATKDYMSNYWAAPTERAYYGYVYDQVTDITGYTVEIQARDFYGNIKPVGISSVA